MTVCEKSIIGKQSEPFLCEDGLFISDNFLAVIDGVTAKNTPENSEKTGGRLATEAILNALSALDKSDEKEDVFTYLNNAVLKIRETNPQSSPAACVIIFSKEKEEIWCCGDCVALINNELFSNEKEIDLITSKMRSLVLELAKIEGKTEDELLNDDIGRSFILPVLSKQYLLENANSKYGYEVLNGNQLRTDLIKTYKVKKGDTVVLASDGYPKIFDTLEKTEAYLKSILKENPLCDTDYISTKGVKKGNTSFDDRTYLKFIV